LTAAVEIEEICFTIYTTVYIDLNKPRIYKTVWTEIIESSTNMTYFLELPVSKYAYFRICRQPSKLMRGLGH